MELSCHKLKKNLIFPEELPTPENQNFYICRIRKVAEWTKKIGFCVAWTHIFRIRKVTW